MMVHDSFPAACAGSLTPQLEGAARSIPHPVRSRRIKPPFQAKKGGARHE